MTVAESEALKSSAVLAAERQCILQQRWEESGGAGLAPAEKDPPLFGLAFSGGGIRSATFNLGITQALVELNLLKRVDYLSVVSGGSYIGSWLSALRSRGGTEAVAGIVDPKADAAAGQPQAEESPAVRSLRRYSNYLTPRYGLLSLDTMAAVSNINRNLVLNQVIFVSILIALLLLPRITAGVFDAATFTGPYPGLPFLYIAAGYLVLAAVGIGHALSRLPTRPRPGETPAPTTTSSGGWREARVTLLIVLPGALASLFLAQYLRPDLPQDGSAGVGAAIAYVLLFGCLNAAWKLSSHTGLGTTGSRISGSHVLSHIGFSVFTGIACGAFIELYLLLARKVPVDHFHWFAVGPGCALLLTIMSLTLTVHIGLAKRRFTEEAREWFGRIGGLALGIGGAWLFLVGIVALVPPLMKYGKDWLIYGGGLAWLATSVGGLFLAKSKATAASTDQKRDNPLARWLAALAPYILVVGLLGLLSAGIARGLERVATDRQDTRPAATRTLSWEASLTDENGTASRVVGETVVQPGQHGLGKVTIDYLCTANEIWQKNAALVLMLLATVVLLAVLLAFRVDVNLFSMHQFYRNRLCRAYLGASRGTFRDPDPFTDFDPRDDVSLADLARQRPYLLVNAALNITDGKHMEWQERKACSFVFAPGHCGFTLPGGGTDAYRPTTEYMSIDRWRGKANGGTFLGTAMAISGAAANPNSGYHSSPVMSFLMALFNVRLGRWCGNPNHRRFWKNSSPDFGLGYLIKELFNSTGEDDAFVNLSDGGHFENLGIYELVRRRCRLIVVCDAGQDGRFQFEDLGNAVRKCRVDHGAEISIDPRSMTLETPADRQRAVVGRIEYVDGSSGVLVYIKPLLRENESVDVLHYARTHCEFPHQSTADQWFDESQFECYRQLGLRTAREVFGRPAWHAPAADCSQWIRNVVASLAPLLPAAANTREK